MLLLLVLWMGWDTEISVTCPCGFLSDGQTGADYVDGIMFLRNIGIKLPA